MPGMDDYSNIPRRPTNPYRDIPGEPPRRPVSSQPVRRPTSAGGSGPSPQRQQPPRRESAPKKEKPQRPPEGGNRWFRAIVMVLITLGFCLFMAFFAIQVASDFAGLNQEDRQVEIVVPKNATISQVTKLLKETGVITQSLAFQVYSNLKAEDGAFLPGTYIFNCNMGYQEIRLALINGNIKKVEVRITFYEGMTLREIAKRLEENKICEAKEFLDYLDTAELSYEFVDMIPSSGLRFHRMEGYVFPDTYDFFEGEKVSSVAKKFLDNFEAKISEKMLAKMQDMNMSLDETITLASIVQKEAGVAEEMERVASVFLNRLDNSQTYPRLESDVTIHYVEDFIKPYQDKLNQDMYDAYNTYKASGLPVGAICNPGLEAIESVLYPADTDYNFFVTDKEGKYYYAATPEEHYKNVRTAGIGAHGTGVGDEE
ncbi:endolytic transglycosylase MltG [Oscillospiraceae bacterium MB08-C2-2]|nr:endolytic transglycosylase MltG [Oscillospiraceae bacterium MB08-C2-2]